MAESALERTARALDLIPFLSNNPGLTINEIAEKFASSPAQIFKDLERKVKKAEGTIQPPSGETPDGFITRYQEIVRNACLRIFTQ